MHRIFSILLTMIAFLALGSKAKAQTCRVSIGSTETGVRGYIEVYEYDYVHEKPCFPGGDRLMMTFVNQNRKYPKEAYQKGIQGKVICSFVVNTDGSISHVKVLRGVESSLNKEAVRVITSMPCWTPGRLDGHAVPVRVVRPIAFRR